MAISSTIYALIDAARQALRDNDIASAQRLTSIVLRQHPDQLEARHLAGLASYCQIRGSSQLPDLEQVLPLGGHSGYQHLRVGLVLKEGGQLELARDAFRTAALLDYHLLPYLRTGFGGPFNGQVLRAAAFRALAETGRLAEVIETGTYRGTTTEFIAQHVACPIKSTEQNDLFYEFARLRFDDLVRMGCDWARKIELSALDSRVFLGGALKQPEPGTGCGFYYLDAHGDFVAFATVEDPLIEEIRLIRSARRHCVIMIDDFDVPDDAPYSTGQGHTIDQLAKVLPAFDAWFYPLGSQHETGQLRGCIVLSGSPETTALLNGIAELRFVGRT